jgi:hypothetical protein
MSIPLSEEEVLDPIGKLKDKKAAGPDGLYNKHLKASKTQLLTVWAELFSKCMELKAMPQKWRYSTVKVLYKGKEDTIDTDKYRGIALECSPFNVITRLFTRRLQVATDCATRRAVWLQTRKIHSACDHLPFR